MQPLVSPPSWRSVGGLLHTARGSMRNRMGMRREQSPKLASVHPVDLATIPGKALDEYYDLFNAIDDDGSGDVTTDELAATFKSMQIQIADSELNAIIGAMDNDRSGTVSFAEFAVVLHALVLARREVADPLVYAPPRATEEEEDDEGSEQVGWSRVRSTAAATVIQARATIWESLEDPSSSSIAQLFSWWILILIAISVTTFVVETVPGIHRKHDATFELIELVCMINFVVEFGLRVGTCPSQREFWTDSLNLVDFVAILPFFIELSVQANAQGTSVIRAVRLVRVFRVVKVSRYLAWLRVFAATVAASVAPLGMILFVVTLTVVLLGSITYNTDRDASPGFGSIPETFWWCIVTMTTIGFGRVVPTTTWGKIFGAIGGLAGVVILAIPISVIATNFQVEFAKLTTSRAAATRSQESEAASMDDGAPSRRTSWARPHCCRARSARVGSEVQSQNVEDGSHPGAERRSLASVGETVARPAGELSGSAAKTAVPRHWSSAYLRTAASTTRSNRRRVMSALKQIELRHRDSLLEEAEAIVGSIDEDDRARFLASQAEKDLF